MPTLRLWISPGSCSLAPHILIREADADFELVKIDVRSGFPEQYRHLNPKGRVPILQLGEDFITEAPSIMTAISQLAPTKHLLGTTNLEIVRTYEWFNWLSGTLHGQGFGGLLRSGRFSADEQAYDSIKAKSRETIEECYDQIEPRLDGLHAVGHAFTAVDAFLFVFYRWGFYRMGFDMRAKYPNFTRLVSELIKRDSVKAAVKEEGISLLGHD